ncbi:sensor histidine kinase [Butyrivibrio sp. MC2021]|uniref:sensor histidine kinase n=1 Tax=Butyrivibrio sp. MC2021 TaxID=1408306 RepID=UPI00047BC087|nr:sensor histidine kinase [Butyrivibrio sp. MC2021]
MTDTGSRKRKQNKSRLANQIRISYLILLLPNIIFMVYAFYNLWLVNERYNKMLSSVVAASEFSLDFKEDFDYETYLLIVGNVTPKESRIPGLLEDAGRVVDSLQDYTDTPDNLKRIDSAKKYLNNLSGYIEKIEVNLEDGNRYEKNMLIWENDVQIVTALLQETINEYIYYENRQIQSAQADNRQLYIDTARISVMLFFFILAAIIVVSVVGPMWITRPIEEQVIEEQKKLRKAEFEVLQAQINPHFLYNTLDAIVWSAEAGNQKQVVSMVGSLSEFFKSSLNKGKEIVSVRDELQHVRSYLEIQQIRYQDILSYEIDVPNSLNECTIPKITLQPVVENALYHGIKNRRALGKITVKGIDEEDTMVLQVTDDGIGMDEERLSEVRKALSDNREDDGQVYGLYNVNERIRLNYGDEYGISIESTKGEGTCVMIRLPKILTGIVEK